MSILAATSLENSLTTVQTDNRPVEPGQCYRCGEVPCFGSGCRWLALPETLDAVAIPIAASIKHQLGTAGRFSEWTPGQISILRAVGERLIRDADIGAEQAANA